MQHQPRTDLVLKTTGTEVTALRRALHRVRRLSGPLLMPVLAWSVVLAAQSDGVPPPGTQIAFSVLHPSASESSRVENHHSTWYDRADEGLEFTLRHAFVWSGIPNAEPLAVYVPSVERNVEVFLNGAKVGDGGRLTPPVERNRHRPLLFTLPSALLRLGRNDLDLRVVGEIPGEAFIRPVYLAPLTILSGPYQALYAFKITTMQITLVALLLMAAFAGSLWAQRRRATIYGWFAGGLVFWAGYNTHYLLRGWPSAQPLWHISYHIALGASLHCMLVFVNRFTDTPSMTAERRSFWATFASALLLAGSTLMLDPRGVLILINYAYRWILLMQGIYMVGKLGVACVQRRSIQLYWLASAGALTLTFGIHDSLRQTAVLDPTVPNLMQYGALLALMVFGYILLHDFVHALGQAENLNLHLDSLVQIRSQELAAEFQRNEQLEVHMAVSAERERIMREMHDGIGGQLVSLLAAARRGTLDPSLLQGALDECLSDLRLMIDSMDGPAGDLAVALRMFRGRIAPRLHAGGMSVDWNFHELPESLQLGPEKVLHVLRILQEAIQNVIKHSNACKMRICAQLDPIDTESRVSLVVEDDGIGIQTTICEGRGKTNMTERAVRLGGHVALDDLSPGTRLTLSFPTRQPRESESRTHASELSREAE